MVIFLHVCVIFETQSLFLGLLLEHAMCVITKFLDLFLAFLLQRGLHHCIVALADFALSFGTSSSPPFLLPIHVELILPGHFGEITFDQDLWSR